MLYGLLLSCEYVGRGVFADEQQLEE